MKVPVPVGADETREQILSPCGCTLTIAQARTIRARLNSSEGGGRPRVLKPCRYCREKFGARELREHEPRCPKRP